MWESGIASEFISSASNVIVYMRYLSEPPQDSFDFDSVNEWTVYDIMLHIKNSAHGYEKISIQVCK